jgi:glycosyltransferase involved in cell wall biosynthesis
MSQPVKKICVGIDIRDLKVAKTGQKTVIEGLYRQFSTKRYPGIHFVFFISFFPAYTGKKKWLIMVEHLRFQFWKQVELPIRAWLKGCDIVFGGDYFVPYVHLGFKTITIFHDAFFFENPEHYNPIWLKMFHGIAVPSARRCARIITVSEYAKGRLHQLAGFPLAQIVAIHTAPKILDRAMNIPDNAVPAIEHKKYFLHVGVMEKRKNLPALISAFHLLTQKGYDNVYLVLAGQGSGKINSEDFYNITNAVQELGLQNKVILTGYLTDQQLSFVYRNAFAYVFPSLNEGFGLPLLEAFSFGLPVLASNSTSLPEVGGDAALYFDPSKPHDIADKMERLINDPSLRNELIQKGSRRLEDFSWENTGDTLVRLFKEIAHGQ